MLTRSPTKERKTRPDQPLASDRFIAIDPGPLEAGVVVISPHPFQVVFSQADMPHALLEGTVARSRLPVVVEDIRNSYGNSIDNTTVRTIKNIGRLEFLLDRLGLEYAMMPRIDVKMTLLGRAAAKDAEVSARVREIVSTITGVEESALKGRKKDPGPCYGMKSHSWQALALALAARWATIFGPLYTEALGKAES